MQQLAVLCHSHGLNVDIVVESCIREYKEFLVQ